MDAIIVAGAKNFRHTIEAEILKLGVEVVLLEEILLGLNWKEEAHHQEGQTWPWKGISLGLNGLGIRHLKNL